jgi:methylglutaconyl-CoA hydratase
MSTVIVKQEGAIVQVSLNRPEVRNAFNNELINDLLAAFQKIEKEKETRVVIFSGEGGFFCAGADLNWMKSFVGASKEVNERDAQRLAELLSYLDNFPKPIIAKVHGAAIGGGVGLVAVADIALAAEETVFALAEVKLGLIPAVISPFVMKKMGSGAARRYFLTGERFENDTALRYGLIHEEVEPDELGKRALEIAKEFLSAGPEAVKACKELVRFVGSHPVSEVQSYTVKKIAELRVGAEGQEGIKSFLEKRKPNWNV